MSKIFIENRGLYVQNRFKGCIFQCSSIKGPRVLTKLLKVPMSVLRRLMIKVIILLDHLFIFWNTMKVVLVTLGFVIFLLQHLGFMMNFKKCILEPTQEIGFLGMVVNSKMIT